MRKFLRILGFFFLSTLLLLVICWASAAMWFDGPASRQIAGMLAAAYVLASFLLLVTIRPRGRACACFLALFVIVLGWWLSLEPSNAKNWQRDVAQLSTAKVQGSTVTIRNLRNFFYRSETDFDERWETRSYDLSEIRGLDLFIIYWGSPAIAHTILSWQFYDGQYLAVSIETRKQEGQSYSALRGFFRQYELYYVVADERDVIKLRTNHRNEDVYLYQLRTPPVIARAILLDYLKTINKLAHRPTWYNALIHNCTTTIRLHVNRAIGAIPHDWRWLLNGYLDELLYEAGALNRTLPFDKLKSLSYINLKAREAMGDNFSMEIRKDLPPRPRHQ